MPFFTIARRMVAALVLVAAASAGSAPALALDKVTFGTNWVAEAEHGGFYQAVADGTYKKYGLDVTILPGGPNANNRMLLLVDKLDFYLSANTLQGFDAIENNIPTVEVAAMFQKDPQVLIAHPDQGIDKFEDLKKLTLFISKEGLATYYPMAQGRLRFSRRSGQALHFQSAAVSCRQEIGDARLCDLRAVCHRTAGQVQAEDFPAGRSGLLGLFDVGRDAPRPGRQKAGSGAALCRCFDHRLVQLHLRRQQRGQRADQEPESRNDRCAPGLFRRQDERIRHRRFR